MYEWNLENIYPSINSEQFKKDYADYIKKIDFLNIWSEETLNNNTNQAEKIQQYLDLKNELCKYNKLHNFVQLSLSTDSTNPSLLKMIDNLESVDINLSKHEVLFKKFISQIENLEDILKYSETLFEHKFFLNELKESANHILPVQIEETISKMKTCGSLMWKKQWEQITSTLKNNVVIDNKVCEMSLTQLRNLAYSSDENVRFNAYISELEAYKKIETAGAFSLNGIKNEVISICELRGYSSPLAMTLCDSRINEKVLEAMFSAIKKELPYFREYLKAKANYLGNKDGLPFYNLFAPIGELQSSYTYKEACKIIIDAFSSFSCKLASFAKNAFEKNWIDVMPKDGKVGGAFCEVIHSIKESRILTNFSGTFNDIITIAHELGHAYHDSCLYNTSELNAFYPMPIAETASTFCETIINKYMFSSLSSTEKLFILEKDLSESTQVIVDIYSRFLFEDDLFNKRKTGFIPSDELCSIMENAQLKAYGDGLDKKYLHKYMWLCKCHYYDADFNYYNFPYAFGLLLSKGLYSKYIADKTNFVSLYDDFLSKSSTNNLMDLCKTINIDLTDESFWKTGLDILKEDIKLFISMLNQN